MIATVAGVGLLRPAPGTWGTLAALPLAWALHVAGGPALLIAATGAVFALGWWATRAETRDCPDADPAEIVIDEVAGMWLTLWPVSLGAALQGVAITALWPGWVVAFAAFRAFDIWKPGPVGLADRMPAPMGVMLDDMVAGALAATVVATAAVLAHAVLGA